MDFDYEADLNRLKEQQKQQAIAELEKQKNQSLSDLNAEEQTVKPTYYKKKDTANVQNQVSARNFHEYLVNSGRSNSGIGAQYEMSRKNTLQRNLNDINLEEAGVLSDIARRRTDVNNAYNTGLTGANAQIEADYIQNLLTQRQAAWERDYQQKQYDESVRQFNENLAQQQRQFEASLAQQQKEFDANYKLQQRELALSAAKSQAKASTTKKQQINTQWYQGDINSDAKYGTFGTKDIYGQSYQPDNVGAIYDEEGNVVGVKRLSSTGKTVGEMYGAGQLVGSTGANLDNQTVWKYGKNYYIWDGSQNQYVKM